MFNILKKKPATKVTKEPEATEEPKATEKLHEKPKRTNKVDKPESSKAKQGEPAEDATPQAREDLKEAETPFVCAKEYSSTEEIAEKIDREIAETKGALGRYLRRLDDTRAVVERLKRLHDVVAKLLNKKEIKENPNKIEVNGLEIVLDAIPLNELTSLESVVKNQQQRLLTLQKAQESLETLNQAGDTEGIRYIVVEREGIPERVLLKLS